MKGLIKARGICVRISIVMDTAQHKASTRSSLRSSPWPTERCARTPHCPCRVISRTASTSRGLGAADRGATARRAAPIGCCPIRAARPLRTSSTTYSASAARDEVDRCAAASSASRRAACPTATSSSSASPQHGPTSARPQRESERRAWTSATRTTMWARAVRRVSVVYAGGRV